MVQRGAVVFAALIALSTATSSHWFCTACGGEGVRHAPAAWSGEEHCASFLK